MEQNTNHYDQAGDPEDDKKITENTGILFSSLKDQRLLPEEKEQIWNRILHYVQSDEDNAAGNSFRRTYWYQAAAAIALLVLFGLGYQKFRENTDEAMLAAAGRAVISSSDVQLMLADDRTINLKGDQADVVYNNATIRIDSQHIARQLASVQPSGLNTLVVPFGKRSTITLPDGTKIWLNSGSKLVYPSDFEPGKREVFLEGQAFFSVARDTENPFYVQTKDMNVKVLGTEFDISSYDDDDHSHAVLAEGSIELVTNKNALFGSKKTIMQPGTRAVYGEVSKSLSISKVDIGEFVSWKEGYLVFRGTPLDEVLKKLSRYYKYDLSVQHAEAGKETFSGSFDLQEDIEHAMNVLETTTSLRNKKTERRYILEKVIR
jgi:transmembrane sensor